MCWPRPTRRRPASRSSTRLSASGAARRASASISETGIGADITMNLILIPFLYDEKYADVGDIAERWEKSKAAGTPPRGKWRSSTANGRRSRSAHIGQLMNWRSDWFAEVGFKKFPETWDELYEAGKKLKAKGHPFGFELGHGFGDNHGWLYPLLWSYGGPRGGRRRQDDHRSIQTRPRAPSISPGNSSRIRCSRMCSAGQTRATTRRGWPSRSRAPTMPRASFGLPRRIFPRSARSPSNR